MKKDIYGIAVLIGLMMMCAGVGDMGLLAYAIYEALVLAVVVFCASRYSMESE